jgi:pimeloyl-ACP methyl ester carboxylesterase
MSATFQTDDEFALLSENASEVGLPWKRRPIVERRETRLPDGRTSSSILWGTQPEVVFLHGGGQNAHTWDTVVLAMGLDALALDLPGHGHSDQAREPGEAVHDPVSMAEDVHTAIGSLAPRASMVVGMSMGGLVGIVIGSRFPDLVRRLAIVDVTPGVSLAKAATMGRAGPSQPESFATIDEIVDRTVAADPARSASSLRRGVIHNTRQLPNGRWTWRHDRRPRDEEGFALRPDGTRYEPGAVPDQPPRNRDETAPLYPQLWDDVSALRAPTLLVVGSRSGVVDDTDRAELLRRQPEARVVTIEDAGHRVQGDQPIALAGTLSEFLDR